MTPEARREQLSYQSFLDEIFRGGRIISMVSVEGVRAPAFDMIVGRLFCTQAKLAMSEEWVYEVMADPNVPGTQGDEVRPWRFWVDNFYQVEEVAHPLLEASVIDPETGLERMDETVRVLPGLTNRPIIAGDGQEISLERMREHAERWIPVLFPEGLEMVTSGDNPG